MFSLSGVAPVGGSLFGISGGGSNGGMGFLPIGGGYGLGGGGTQGQNALPLWGLPQGGNTQSGWQIGGSTGGGQLYGTYLLGGGGSTDTYIEPWMPDERAALIRRTGMSTLGTEVQALKKQIDAEKNNYNKRALTEQYNNAMIRWQKEWENQIPAYRNLALSGLRQQAERAVAANTAIGEPTNLNAMWGNSVLSNNNVQIGFIQQGKMIAPRGNALEDALAAGLDPRSSLAQFLADQDVFSQEDYMPGSRPSLMNSYGSMGMGFAGQGGKVFGYDNAYGGTGRQAAVGDAQNMLRDYNWTNDALKSYQASMDNKNPMGSFKGGEVQRGPGLPGIDANGWIPDWMGDGKYSPDQLSKALSSYDKSQGYYSKRGVTQVGDPTKASGKGSGQVAGAGYDPYDYGAMVPSYSGPDPNGWVDGYSTGSRNPQRFDPTVASDQYSPKLGNLTGWNQERMSKPYLQQDEKYPMQGSDYTGNPKPGRSFGQMLKGIGEAAIAPLKGVQNTWTPSYKGLFGTGPLFGDGDSRGLAAYSGPMLQPAMGIAQAPKIQRVSSPPRPGSSFGGSMSPSNDIFADQFAAAPSRGNSTTWPYGMRTQSSSFDRYPTGPMTAGQIQALMYGGF